MFWQLPNHSKDSPLWVFEKETFTVKQVEVDLAKVENYLQSFERKTIGAIYCQNNPAALMMYLAALRTGNAVILLPSQMNQALRNKLLDVYQVDWIFNNSDEAIVGYKSVEIIQGWHFYKSIKLQETRNINTDLALLLPTSGSTGSPKMVRISYDNLASNAESIANYLALNVHDRAITSLPFSYSYGLSVINSHIHSGASFVLTGASFMQPEFWENMQQDVTNLAAVPSQYEMLRRLKLEVRAPKTLRILTQAGGKLSNELVRHFADLSIEHDWQFFVMYGQTEATARIAYMPPDSISDYPDFIGKAVDGGTLYADSNTGELIYEGSNVMMGYAERADDLYLGDECNGILRTGDIGEQDSVSGFWKITGRLKRFVKLAGLRINLDEVESYLNKQFTRTCICTGVDDAMHICVVGDECSKLKDNINNMIFEYFSIHPTLVNVSFISDVPLTSSGKIDYKQLNLEML